MPSPNAKLITPKRQPKTLRRVRLLDTLHDNIHRKVTFICAPAGYGKTTLLVDFAEDVDAIVFWYRISPEDNTLSTFYENIFGALQPHFPKLSSDQILSSGKQNASPQELAYQLVNQIQEAVQDFSVLVLDDYHLVSEEPAIAEFIETLIHYLPDHLRLLFGSRNVYGVPTAVLYVQEQLAIISEEDLKFRQEEIADLCWKYYHIQLSDEQLGLILDQAEGWIVAILLALRSKNLTVEIPKIIGAKEHIYTYMAQEVIQSLPKELLDFLHATSLVDEFSVPLANHILGIGNAREIIKQLEELNLFLSSVSDPEEEASYRYHQLFSDFLRENLTTVAADKVRGLHEQIAAWYAGAGHYTKAIAHYFQAGKKRAAVELIDQVAREMYLTGQTHLLEQWHDQLADSEELLTMAPQLLLNLAKVTANRPDFYQAERLLAQAEEPFLARQDRGNYAALLVTRGIVYRYTERHEEAYRLLEQVQADVLAHNLDRYYWIQAERVRGMCAFSLRKGEEALKRLATAAKELRNLLGTSFRPHQALELWATLTDLGYVALAGGRIFEAQAGYRDALDLAKRMRSNTTVTALALNNYGYFKSLIGDYQEAWQCYLQGLELAEQSNNEWIQCNLYNGQGDILSEIGDWEQAEAAYQNAHQISECLGKTNSLVSAVSGLARVAVYKNDFSQAQYYLREMARLEGADIHAPEFQARLGQIYLAMGQTALAADTFEKALAAQGINASSNPSQESALLQYDCARSLLELGQIDQAVEHLQNALKLTARLGYDKFLENVLRKDRESISKLAERIDSPQLEALLERAKRSLPTTEELVGAQQEEALEAVVLHVSGLNSGEIRLNGQILPNKAWSSIGAKALFFFILDRKRVTKDVLALEFWPDFSQAKVNSNFHATLWRVRKALGSKSIIQFEDGAYRFSPEVQIYYDVDEFEDLLQQLGEAENPTARRAALRRAVELYQSDFIEDIDMSWADERRLELQGRFRALLAELAEEDYQKNNLAAALDIYQRAVAYDPFQEQYHLRLIQCMVGLGDLHAARMHYQQYAARLQKEMGISPDDALSEFAASLN